MARMNVAIALWRIEHHPRGPATLRDLLGVRIGHDSYRVRYHACRHLAELGPSVAAAVPDVLALLRDEDPMVRREAAVVLGEIATPTPEVLAGLRAAQHDAVWTVRDAATRTLKRIQSPDEAVTPTP